MASLRRNALVAIAFNWGSYVLQLLSLVLLARLLAPADYGLVAMVAAIVGIASVIGDFGLSLAAVRARELSQAQKTNLFWMNAGIGLLTSLAVLVAGPFITTIYREPRLENIVLLLSSTFLLNGLTVQFKVELNRAFRFTALGSVDLVAQAASLALALLLASAGTGYWALVSQQVAFSLLSLVISIGLTKWRPGWPRRKAQTRALLIFGRDTLFLQVANYLTTNIDTVMIGRTAGALALGLYNRAFQITLAPIMQILSPLTRVFLPRIASANDAEFQQLIPRLQLVITYVTLGPLSLLSATSGSLPVVLFGARWAPLETLIPILSLASAFASTGFIYYWAFLAKAQTLTLFFSEIVGRLPMALLIVLVAPLGSAYVAGAVAFGQAVIWASSTFLFGRRVDVHPRALLSVTVRPAALFSVAFILSSVVRMTYTARVNSITDFGLTFISWLLFGSLFMLSRYWRDDFRQVRQALAAS